ncbi:hypothetical protein ACFC96_12695 [Streptomyces sp. NPDC055955]|uniref:hypothetical protein n=1 Tax=Streptomyces sp. NPDC055955 TaxID=3345665 RepID=UPI0035D641A2
MNWGDVPTWGGVIFAALAAAATIWTLKSQRDQIGEQRQFIAEQAATLALERAELHAAALKWRQEQARRVRLVNSRPYVGLVNDSDDPITDVTCTDDGVEIDRVFVADSTNRASAELLAAILQGAANTPAAVVGVGQAASFPREQGNRGRLVFEFTDAAGVRWRRDDLGSVSEV